MNVFKEEFYINEIVKDYDFDYQIQYYVIYPWINEDGKLLRCMLNEATGKSFLVKLEYNNFTCSMFVEVYSNDDIAGEDIQWIRKKIIFSLGLKDDISNFVEIAKDDIVLSAAMSEWTYRRNKSSLTLFEAMLNVICAQNIQFSRLYTMSFNLCKLFGKKISIGDKYYYCFPTAEDISLQTLELIKESKVGYRAKTIKNVAEYFSNKKSLFLQIEQIEYDKIYQLLTDIKGVGPYSANLAMSIFFRLPDRPHLDSYVKNILSTFYNLSSESTDEEYLDFCYTKWGKYAGWAISALTTDTEKWAIKLGVKIDVVSGAHISNNPL